MANSLKLSIVIPLCNEQDNVALLVTRLESALGSLSGAFADIRNSYEIIFVDDGSTDATREVLAQIVETHSHIQAVFFRKNFGKSAALGAGFQEASGEIILTMDGDLQDEPNEIQAFLTELARGYDLVSGWKKTRNDPFEKRAFSKVFNFIVSRLTGLKLHDFNCGFKAYRAWCVKNIQLSGNLYRFLPVFVARQGGKVGEIAVKHNKRMHGKSKYGAKRYFHGFFDLITITMLANFFYKPMYFFGAIALPLLGGAFVVFTYLVGSHIYWLFSGDISYQLVNRPLLGLSLTIAGFGLNFLLVGLLAELMLQLNGKSQTAYLYSIEKVLKK